MSSAARAEDDRPTLGYSLWLCDPNDPEIYSDAIAGGMVLETKVDDDGCLVYVCGRLYRGALTWTDVQDGSWVVKESGYDPALAWNVYRGCCLEIAKAGKPKSPVAFDWHLKLLTRALVAARIASGRTPHD